MISTTAKTLDLDHTFKPTPPRTLMKRVHSPSAANNQISTGDVLEGSLATFHAGTSALKKSMEAAFAGDWDRAIALLKN